MKGVVAFLLVLSCLAVSHAWRCREAPRLSNARQVDAGMGMVVATDSSRRPFFLSGRYWYRLGTAALKHVSVGPAGTWGTCASNRVYKLVAGNFRQHSGLTMQQVDAGGDGQVVGVRPSSYLAYCLREVYALRSFGGGLPWAYLGSRMRYYSCGPLYGCWGVATNYRVYVSRGPNSACANRGWIYAPGVAMKMVEVSTDGIVFGVSTRGLLYQRLGISSRRPQGTSWRLVSMCMTIRHVSYDLRRLWIVTTSGMLMTCV